MGVPLVAVATGALCTVFVPTAPVNALLGGGQASRVQSCNGVGAVTVTAGTAAAPSATAPGWIRSLASINLEASTSTYVPTTSIKYDFQGTVIVPPNFMIYFAAGVATVALYASTVVWKEIPINPNLG